MSDSLHTLQMADLIVACQPGKHFLGLWICRVKNHRTAPVRWTVTFWDRHGEYWETNGYADPMRALRECARHLKVGAKGRV